MHAVYSAWAVFQAAGGVDHRAGDSVHLLARGSGPHRPESRELGVQHQRIDLHGLTVEFAGGHGAGAVRAVSVELGAPVDHHERSGADLDVAGLGMRQGAVGAGGDDRLEARPLRSGQAHLDLERQGDFPLGLPDQTGADHPLERAIRQRGRGSHARDLLRVLDGPQPLGQPVERRELDPLWELPPQTARVPHRHVPGLEPEPQRTVWEHVGQRRD